MYFAPIVPTDAKNRIEVDILEKAQKLCINSAKLSRFYNKEIIKSLKKLFEVSNLYHANKLEKMDLHPKYIYEAMRGHFSDNPKTKNLQSLYLAHLHVDEYLQKNVYFYENPYSEELLSTIHERFYFDNNMDKFLQITKQGKTYSMLPGVLRDINLMSREHEAPNFNLLTTILHHFGNSYALSLDKDKITKLIYALSSHHRFIWIHPFLFANMRISIMHLDYLFRYLDIYGYGLWGISRAIKRNNVRYKKAILEADLEAKSVNEGQLSKDGLEKFIHLMLDIANEEVEFSISNFEKLPNRMKNYVKLSQSGFFDEEPLPKNSELLFEKLLIYGEFPRGEVRSLINKQERSATYFIKKLTKLDFIYSDSPRGNLKLNFNLHFASKLFPELLPE